MNEFDDYHSGTAAEEALRKIIISPEAKELEKIISQSSKHILKYANFKKSRFEQGEKNIISSLANKHKMTHVYISQNKYANEMLGGRWKEYEEEIIKQKNTCAIVFYAINVLKKPWKEFEKILFKDFHVDSSDIVHYLRVFYPEQSNEVLDEIILSKIENKKFPIKNIDNENNALTYYLKIKGKWKELEEKLINYDNNGYVTYTYCFHVLKSRWKEIENKLLSNIKVELDLNSACACQAIDFYTRHLVKNSWPELEDKLNAVNCGLTTHFAFSDLVINYSRYCKKAYLKVIEKLDSRKRRNYVQSATKIIEKMIKNKQFEEVIRDYSEMPEFSKIITRLEDKYVMSDCIKNYMIANKLVNEHDSTLNKYFQKDKLFKEKLKVFLEEFKDLTVKDVLSKI